jgi:hypothetical protein
VLVLEVLASRLHCVFKSSAALHPVSLRLGAMARLAPQGLWMRRQSVIANQPYGNCSSCRSDNALLDLAQLCGRFSTGKHHNITNLLTVVHRSYICGCVHD